MTSKDLAIKLARIADEKKARDIKILEIVDLTVLADYFVICSGTSSTHVKTLSDEMEFVLKREGISPHHIEGHISGNWMLLDYNGVVAHVFLQETREFYELERLWADARIVPFETTPAAQ